MGTVETRCPATIAGDHEKQARQTLLHRKAFASMIEGAILTTMDTREVIECNEAFARMLGYSNPAQVVGLHPWDWDAQYSREEILQIPVGIGETVRIQTKHRRLDGEIRDVDVSISTFETDGVPYFFCIARDITELNLARSEREKSELRARLATESAGTAIWEWDAYSDRLVHAPLVCTILETEPGTLVEYGAYLARLHPEDLDRYKKTRALHLRGETENYAIDIRVRRSDGSYKWVNEFGKIIERDEQGWPVRIVGTLRDVHQRKLAEQKLRVSEANFRACFETTRRLVGILSPEGRFLAANPGTRRFSALPEDTLRSLYFWEGDWWLCDDDRARIREAVHAAASGNYVQFEISQKDRNGDLYVLDFSITPIRDETGEILSLMCEANDITPLKRAEVEIQKRQELLTATFDNAPGGVLLIDQATGEIVRFNDHLAKMHGYTWEETQKLSVIDFKAHATAEIVADKRRRLETESSIVFEDVHRRKDGSTYDALVKARRVQVDGRWYALAVWTDISEVKNIQRALHAKEQEFRTLVEHTPDGIIRYDRDLRRVFINPAMRNFLGFDPLDLSGKVMERATGVDRWQEYTECIKEVFRTGEPRQMELRFRTHEHPNNWSLASFAPEHDETGEVVSVLAMIRDITELVNKREHLRQLAYNDPLTGLANRTRFAERFSDMVASCRGTGDRLALLVFDLDRFKDINDSLGHAAGDDLLRQIGGRLVEMVPDHEMLARLGGDEFALLLPDCKSSRQIDEMVELVQRAFLAPFQLGGKEVFASTSMGISRYPDDGQTPDELFAHADVAMYGAKAAGRGGVLHYTPELTEEVSRRLALSTDLRSANLFEQLHLAYQPKVALANGDCIGAEALLRWQHPKLGWVSPAQFIPIAEETGAIVDIGRWVLLEACRTAVAWNKRSPLPLRVAVNLSSRQFVNNDIVADVAGALSATGCSGEWLECEITESIILEDNCAVQSALASLADMGITIAIDDFGTGQSALAYLNRFHVDVLKIDRSFVDDMEHDRRKAELIKAFILVADALGMETVAEGVESMEQALQLRELGCVTAQGYHFGKPLAEAEFARRFLDETEQWTQSAPAMKHATVMAEPLSAHG